jgi:protein phosphatase
MAPTPKLIMLVGIPGCGKSTFAERWFPTAVVASDEIRKELHGDPYNQDFNDKVFEIFHLRICSRFCCGYAIAVADSTALSQGARERLWEVAKDHKVEIHAIVFANPEQAVLRNAAREVPVPDDAMATMIEKYEKMLVDLPNETYDSVTYIKEVQ